MKRFEGLLRSSGFWSLLALVLGLALGIYGFESGNEWVAGVARALQPVGTIWLNALQLVVLPLVVLQLLTAICGNGNGKAVAKAGTRAVLSIFIALFTVSLFAYFIAAPIIGLYEVSPETVAAIRDSVVVPASVQSIPVQSPTSLGDWLVQLVPSNLFDAVAAGNLIQLLIISAVFGLAVNRLPEEQRDPLARLFRAGADATMVIIRWTLVLTPVGVFALVLGMALETGSDAVELLGFYFVVSQSILLFFVLLLYPVTAVLGRVPVGRFARAAAKPQLVAVSTRSSIASMPAQIESGREILGFSQTTSGFLVPLLVSTFKLQTPIQNSVRILFLAHIFGITLTFPTFLSFAFAIVLLSLTSLGVPVGATRFRTIPAYASAGIPLEGVVLVQTIQDLADYVYTLTNTTGQFALATILDRVDGQDAGAPEGGGG